MKNISTKEYEKVCARLEELLPLVNDNTPQTDPNYIELMKVSDIIEAYEKVHYKIENPSLIEVIKYIMFERNLNNKKLAAILETNPSRISEYLNGKRQITFDIAKKLHQKLDIDPEIILQ
ncbi:MAG: type II toxin-antitoxin system HigA family antitoxin [Mangrovibacterium sp.]